MARERDEIGPGLRLGYDDRHGHALQQSRIHVEAGLRADAFVHLFEVAAKQFVALHLVLFKGAGARRAEHRRRLRVRSVHGEETQPGTHAFAQRRGRRTRDIRER